MNIKQLTWGGIRTGERGAGCTHDLQATVLRRVLGGQTLSGRED